ncbi:diguanylate cyclase [Parazoarcus communis]|uniref:Diguanylate cyclase n=1 Tax=Parazoarcus communis TaxID=41977 RepID=A0A2U8GQF4_9RHOO|nr:EAL domain-containing protein [Parazoarcus communis]AWI75892.1 diguanylate cyclase [Parazoarcus communis]
MRFFPSTLSGNENTVPRLYLFGTLVIVFLLTLALASFYSWRHASDYRASLSRLEEVVTRQLEERLSAEMSSALSYLEFTRSRSEEELRRTVVEQVDAAVQIAQAIHAQEAARRPAEEVRKLIVEALRPVRFFEGRGYYFIDDMSGRFILLPTSPQLEGRLLPDNQDDRGRYIMRGLIDAARRPQGEGFLDYRWYRPDEPGKMADKLAYVRYFAPYDWLIGAGDYTYEWESLQRRKAMARFRALRFGQSGYIGVLDNEGRLLLSPSDPELEGRPLHAIPAAERDALERIRRKALEGGGLLRYQWFDARLGRAANKVALVRNYEPWGWTLAATVFEDELQVALDAERRAHESGGAQSTSRMLLNVALALLLALAASLLFSRWSRKLFRAYHAENLAQREALRRQAIELRESEDRLEVILDSVEAFIYIKGADYRYQYANRQVCELFVCDLKNVVGRDDGAFFDAETAKRLRENDARVIEAGERVATEEVNTRHGEDEPRTFLSVKIPLRREDGSIYALCGISTDITQRKVMEDEIRLLAFYDALTGLPNRRLLVDRLQQQLAASGRSKRSGALLFIDLDNFKTLNDTLGHDKGDLLLKHVAARLVHCVREGDTVARLGGDEFVVMLGNLGSDRAEAAAHARGVGEKILKSLGEPHDIDGQLHFSTPSIGVALFAGKNHKVDDLLRQADLAMYQAKADGRNTMSFFDPEMQAALNARAALEADLRRGLKQGQFELHYQPQVDYTGALIGAEALLRWNHPTRGLVQPDAFIPVAEDTGLIVPLGAWVLDTACAQLRAWSDTLDTAALTLSVNVSARQFRQADFVDLVLSALDRSGANPRCLKLELTESLLLVDAEETIARMAALKAHGVGFSLDDFGTGYSSLSYLKRLPLDQLKIDRSFVRDLLADPNDAAIARAIITLAESLGLSVIAEGVETVEQRDALARQGCLSYQGYYFGRPGPVEALFKHRA